MRKVITYGTFDTIHFGHISLLQRARNLGDYLIVGLSTDEFNAEKGKQSYFNYEQRQVFLKALRYVDLVIPERTWAQKEDDIVQHQVDVFTMGDDWTGKFDNLTTICEVRYLGRTPNVSSTLIKEVL